MSQKSDPSRRPTADGRRTGPMATILVVDDEPELCRALSKLLTRNGYQVLTAGNGEEGLAILRQRGNPPGPVGPADAQDGRAGSAEGRPGRRARAPNS